MLPVAGSARTVNPDDSGFPVRRWRIVAADRWGWRRNEIPDYDASSTAAWIAGGFLMAGNRNERRRVRVWFGDHAIADYRANAELAERYVAAMEWRIAGLRITNEPMPEPDPGPGPGRALPGERLWDLTPR